MSEQPSLFTTLYSECDGVIEFRTILPKHPTQRYYFDPKDTKAISEFIRKHRAKWNIYFAVSTRDGQGGKKANIHHIPAVWVDIDFKTLPGGQGDADRIIGEFPAKPTAVVASGGGYHCYWVLKEPAEKSELEEVERILKGLAEMMMGDPACAEAAHILRVPNTQNQKYKPARKVILQYCNGTRYSLSDFDFLPAVPVHRESEAPREYSKKLVRIMSCLFMQYCQDRSATLPEPAWYAMITQLMSTPGGVSLIHKISKPHPKYRKADTDGKIMHAMDSTGPMTCAKIRDVFKEWSCGQDCGVASPAALAFREEREEREESRERESTEEPRGTTEEHREEHLRNNADAILADDIRLYVSESPGIFTARELDIELGVKTLRQRKTRSNILGRLINEGLVEKISASKGTFRSRDRKITEMAILAADPAEFPMYLPFDLNQWIEINNKEIILVAGESNAGKTTLIFDMMWGNIRYLQEKELAREKGVDSEYGGIALRYFSSEMGAKGVLKKLKSFGASYPPEEFVRYVLAAERNRDFHDVVDPDGINFIDYLEVFDGEYFKLASALTLIHAALKNGIAVVGLQKKSGTDIGRGGEATLEKPRLALALSENKPQGFFTVKITKAKHYRDKNPVGLERDFIIRRRGTALKPVSDWGYEKAHRIRRSSATYHDWD